MNCSTPGFPALHYLLEFAQINVQIVPPPHWQWWHPNISSSAALFFCLWSFPASESFPMSWLFPSGGQSIGASASASVFPMYIQGWFPLGLTGCGWVSESKCHMVWWGSVLGSVLGDQSLVVLWQAKSHQDETSPVYSLIILQSGLCWTWGCPPGKTHFYSSFAHIALCGGEHKALSHVICL